MTVLDNRIYSEQSPPLLGELQGKNKNNSKDVESGLNTREKWGKEIEFLLSCIALSVGLGNVWRFPFIALENGGGAFVIPYIIVLLLIGRPVYYMEVIIGQFSSRGCIRAFDMVPVMRGVGYGQVYATALATTYYACIMGLTVKYLIASFSSILPWAYCLEEWGSNCVNATINDDSVQHDSIDLNDGERGSSAEFYFTRIVLNEVDNLDYGLGTPSKDLLMCLAITWIIIGLILWKGIKSSGKASYFLAIFPYVVLILLFVRAITLPGSINGIIYFLKPQWNQLLNPKVWYNAITQVFFSLAICFGTLIMYASFNNFRKRVYRDVIIITTIDSFTSMLAGCVIFGILGNLAYELKTDNIRDVVKGGAGLAFISYPDAIAKFQWLPQVFAVLFFSMLLVLGIGSNIGMSSCVITVIKDKFIHIPHWMLAGGMSIFGFICGIIYMTPGGQFILNLIDFFGCSFIGLFLAIFELIAVAWIYGVNRLCKDIEFMFGIKTGLYWRICWAIITPSLMITVLIYLIIEYQPLKYKNIDYPPLVMGIAWVIYAIGILQLPIWAIYAIYQQPQKTLIEKIKSSFKPTKNWGPLEKHNFEDYQKYRINIENNSNIEELKLL
ncbi:sodium-dependent nutrient amino acid transporter 1 [Condylostylus longicornis]|uniref:sodium-dependent nutrient amino acid transporter 1 n=1 Tax=Condylostylus longicornis TaxID=2530218 RepID=UPI00244E4F19|nr:sodium-dependent nutrient amino acid transporter 1 [Condylostylus longicornis]